VIRIASALVMVGSILALLEERQLEP